MKKYKLAIFLICTMIFLICRSAHTKNVPLQINKQNYAQIHDFFINNMISPEGGVYTNFKNIEMNSNETLTKGHYILSESQGLLLEYAIKINDKNLFLKTWNFLKDKMSNKYGGFVWRISPEYARTSEFTSTLDDLQIVLQLIRAEQKWPDFKSKYSNEINTFSDHLEQYLDHTFLINGYDSFNGSKMHELNSCYIYLEALKEISSYTNNKKISDLYDRVAKLLEKMYIGEKFPFFYERFFVKAEMIEQNKSINMVESLLSALHQSQISKLHKSTKEWLKSNVDTGIFGCYSYNGQAENDIESSAIYGITAQIAYYENDAELYEKSLEKGTSLFKYAIEHPDEAEILSYDNLQLLIAYALGAQD